MVDSPAIAVQGLTKRFGSFTAVDKVSFEVQRGEIFGFLGPNGSGKTTTIRMMLGLMKPTSGVAQVLGYAVDGKTAEIRRRVGYMSQRFSLYNDLTVIQNLRFYGSVYGLSNNVFNLRLQEALRLAGLAGREQVKTRDLSGGWRQRLALSAAILHQPEVLFLDEPTAGVDPVSRRVFWDLLYQFVEQGVTIFVTTHYMDEAEHCQRLAFIQRGKIIAEGSPVEMKTHLMQDQVLEIVPSDAVRAVQALRQADQSGQVALQSVELYGALVHVVGANLSSQQRAIGSLLRQAGIQVEQINLIEPSLEDVFIARMQS